MASISANILGAPTDEEKAMRLADALRGQKRAADLFSMSTLSPVAGAARAESQSVMDSAKRGGVLREARQRAEALKAQRDQAQQNWEKQFAYNQTKDDANREALLKKATANKKYRLMPSGQQDKIMKDVRAKNDVRQLISEATESDLGNPLGGMYQAGELSNYIAKEAPMFSSKDSRERLEWFSRYKDAYENQTRNLLFGGALTEGEKAEWRTANINPNMSDEQIKSRLAVQAKLIDKHEAYNRNALSHAGYDPAHIDSLFSPYGEEVPVDSAGVGVGVEDGLEIGHEEDGYRFLGGDPADQSSWEEI